MSVPRTRPAVEKKSAKMCPVGWDALAQWGDDVARIEPLAGGHNDVWSLRVEGHHAGRWSFQVPGATLICAWEIALIRRLGRAGLTVPMPIATTEGRLFADGLVVMNYVEGGPPETEGDWRRVSPTRSTSCTG